MYCKEECKRCCKVDLVCLAENVEDCTGLLEGPDESDSQDKSEENEG